MARGSCILVSTEQRGVMIEGIISGALYPGTCMGLSNTALSGTRFTWAVATPGADGMRQLIAVLLGDDLQGANSTTVYTTGTRGYIYAPAPGEDLNMLFANIAGTSSASELVSIGELLCVENATGKLKSQALVPSPESKPFQAKEATTLVNAYTADTLTWCMFTGY